MASLNENVETVEKVGDVDADRVANPNDLGDVLKKRDELKAGAETKRGRGRPRKNPVPGGAGAGGRITTTGPEIVPDLFTPDTIRPFIELPFGLSNVWLRTDAFSLEPRESDTLAYQGAMVANLYAPGWNPKVVALVAFALGFATISTKKLMVYMAEKSQKEKETTK